MTGQSDANPRLSGSVGEVEGPGWADRAASEWMFEALPDVPALLSAPDGIVLRATGRAAALLGERSADALSGRKISDLIVEKQGISYLSGRHGLLPVASISWQDRENTGFEVTVLVDVSGMRDVHRNAGASVDVNDQLSRLIEAQRIARVGSWTLYPATGHFSLSPVLLELLSDSVDTAISDANQLVDAVYPDDRRKAEQFHRDLMASNGNGTVEVELRSAEGGRVYLCTGRPEHDSSGGLERIQGTVQDVTEHRQLERQLRDERRKLQDAQRAARLGTWVWDPESGRVQLSEMLYEIIGLPHDDMRTFDDYLGRVHPDDREWVRQAWAPLADTYEPIEIEHRYIRGDGVVRVFRIYGAAIVEPDGKRALVGTAQDITEQHTAVARMERSSQRFTDLVAVTPVGIGLFDETERLVDANDALCDLLGYRLEQLRKMSAEQLAHPDESGFGLDEAVEASMTGRRRTPQRLLIRSDGEPVYCELHVTSSVQDDGTRFWLVVFQDVTERRRTAEALLYQATHDELTGLPNRAAVKENLASLLESEASADVAVLFCDIDNFKRVNDSLGHDAGDELLVALARRLEHGLPAGCSAARLSGDEFLIICRDAGAVGGVDSLATKVSSLLRTAVPVHGQLIRVSASIGAAVPNGTGTAGADLLRFADAAMFEAKRRGAGRVSLASPALIASADRQLALEGQLREAIHNDQLELHYQPVVRADGSVASAEALVRWPHPDRGLLSPGAFLPVAEQGDLVRELDRWVLRAALREASTWDDQVSIAVNLAGLVPGDRDFVDVVADTIAECDIEWRQVILELVETALVDLPSRSRQAMGELVDRGVRFAVDDFGTGYSSLARLKDLPAQIIKVDRRFVAGVGGDASDFAVTRAVVDMARAMGRLCVAEGVETATQFHVLTGVGVDYYQGWLFARPMPARDFRAVLERGPLPVPND